MTPRALLAPARLAGQSVLRSQSDERLVDLVATGSEPAFEAIVARYRRPLTGYLRRLLSPERADDALQQTFVRAHAAIERGEQVRNLRAWLYRIAHNSAANLIRDNALPHELLDERLAGAELPDEVADRRETLADVLSAVQSLPLRQRDAIVLRELEGRSYEEIAGELGVTSGAVRALLNRARTAIRSSVSALTPADLLARVMMPVADAPVPALSKMCAAVLVTGTAAGGLTPAAEPEKERATRSQATPVVTAAATARSPATATRAAIPSTPPQQQRTPTTKVNVEPEPAEPRSEERHEPRREKPIEEAGRERHHESGFGEDWGAASGERHARISEAPHREPAPEEHDARFDAGDRPTHHH